MNSPLVLGAAVALTAFFMIFVARWSRAREQAQRQADDKTREERQAEMRADLSKRTKR
jgi:hypothetical protein